jgi:predicted nucleic acid-binding protein
VIDEINAWPTADDARNAITSLGWLVPSPPEPVPSVVAAWDLGPGESGVLAYGLMHVGHTVVVDDLAARRCAAALGIPMRGTLGLVLMAKKNGTLTNARSTLMRLRDSGMYLSDAVANAALREVGE